MQGEAKRETYLQRSRSADAEESRDRRSPSEARSSPALTPPPASAPKRVRPTEEEEEVDRFIRATVDEDYRRMQAHADAMVAAVMADDATRRTVTEKKERKS